MKIVILKLLLQGVRLAQKFEALVLADQRFEIPQPRNLGKQFKKMFAACK